MGCQYTSTSCWINPRERWPTVILRAQTNDELPQRQRLSLAYTVDEKINPLPPWDRFSLHMCVWWLFLSRVWKHVHDWQVGFYECHITHMRQYGFWYDGIQSTAHVTHHTHPESVWGKAKNWMSQNDYSDGQVLSPDLEDSSIMKGK